MTKYSKITKPSITAEEIQELLVHYNNVCLPQNIASSSSISRCLKIYLGFLLVVSLWWFQMSFLIFFETIQSNFRASYLKLWNELQKVRSELRKFVTKFSVNFRSSPAKFVTSERSSENFRISRVKATVSGICTCTLMFY